MAQETFLFITYVLNGANLFQDTICFSPSRCAAMRGSYMSVLMGQGGGEVGERLPLFLLPGKPPLQTSPFTST